MTASVLIAYATRGGSTREVALAIAATMRQAGLTVDVAQVSEVYSLDGYGAVILGAPLYIGRFPRELHAFLREHQRALTDLRPAIFVLGPTRSETADFNMARQQAEKQLERHRWLTPHDLRIFGGRWGKAHLPFPFTLALRLPGNPLAKIPEQDIRDWAAIDQWAQVLSKRIKADAVTEPEPVH